MKTIKNTLLNRPVEEKKLIANHTENRLTFSTNEAIKIPIIEESKD